MRVLLAGGDPQKLLATLHTLHIPDDDVHIVGEAHTEGDLFRVARIEQPQVILVDWSFRPRLTAEWAAYLHDLSGGATLITVYSSPA